MVRHGAGSAADEAVVYADAAVSGNNRALPELRRLFEDARRGGVRRLIVRDLSRLARDPALLAETLATLDACGVVVETSERMPAYA